MSMRGSADSKSRIVFYDGIATGFALAMTQEGVKQLCEN